MFLKRKSTALSLTLTILCLVFSHTPLKAHGKLAVNCCLSPSSSDSLRLVLLDHPGLDLPQALSLKEIGQHSRDSDVVVITSLMYLGPG